MPNGRLDKRGMAWSERFVLMHPGWASWLTSLTASRLKSCIFRCASAAGVPVSGVVVTSPHYLPLVRKLHGVTRCFYYCSDDYGEYDRWGGELILRAEAELVRLAKHSFFVSDLLRQRAIDSYGARSCQVSVSPNATSPEFLRTASADELASVLQPFPQLRRPLVGVVGSVDKRLDYELLLKCVRMPGIGSMVFVGPIGRRARDPRLLELMSHPNCSFIEERPHKEIPFWMQAIDMALIPYCDIAFNRCCSPMRLFDHLASGKPIIATAACPQVRGFREVVHVADSHEEFCAFLLQELTKSSDPKSRQKEIARQHTWSNRAADIFAKLSMLREVKEDLQYKELVIGKNQNRAINSISTA
jgi:glycosyltransferase involved in cell wall biosynthesis